MPDKELRLFIVTEILTPFIEQKAAEGIRMSVHVIYSTGSHMISGPSLERKGKTTAVQATVICKPSPFQNLMSAEIVLHPMPESSMDCPSYLIRSVLRKDDRGYFITEHLVQALHR
jgi:hypothetical protein